MNGFDTRRLGLWFAVLSLDATAPFLDRMLVPVAPSFLHGRLRALIGDNRRRAAQGLPAGVGDLATSVGQALDADGSADFSSWYTHVATVGWNDRPAWAPWFRLFSDWTVAPLPTVLTGEPWFRQLLGEWAQSLDLRVLRAQTEAARRGALTGWDAEMFSLHRYYESEDDEGYDPFIPVRNTIGYVHLRRLQWAAVERLDAVQFAALTQAARDAAVRAGYVDAGALCPFEQLPTA